MDSLLAMKTAVILLTLAALGGILMAGLRFAGKDRPPSSIAMLHGLLVAGAATLLIFAWCVSGIPSQAQLATVVLLIASLGGVYLNLRWHDRQLPLPIGIMLAHIGLAVAGYGLLVLAVIHNSPAQTTS